MTGRLLHVITTLDPGGAENALIDLVTGLAERGWDQRIAWLKDAGALQSVFQALSVPCTNLDVASGWWNARDQLQELCRNVDLVHSHLLKANTLAALSSGPRPLIGSRHNDEAILNRKPVALLHRLLSTRESRHIAISDAVADFYIDRGLCQNKFRVIPYGFQSGPPPVPVDWSVAFEIPASRVRLLHAGRLVPQKGQAVLLEALSSIPEAHLVICGVGPLEQELKTLATDYGLTDRVTFAGFRDDLSALMAGADAFVLPSLWEGLGRVLLEAMAVGCPVIASETSAIPSVLGGTGTLVPPGNPGALIEALRLIPDRNDTSFRQPLADRMATQLASAFALPMMLDRHEALYEEAQDA